MELNGLELGDVVVAKKDTSAFIAVGSDRHVLFGIFNDGDVVIERISDKKRFLVDGMEIEKSFELGKLIEYDGANVPTDNSYALILIDGKNGVHYWRPGWSEFSAYELEVSFSGGLKAYAYLAV